MAVSGCRAVILTAATGKTLGNPSFLAQLITYLPRRLSTVLCWRHFCRASQHQPEAGCARRLLASQRLGPLLPASSEASDVIIIT